MYVDNFFVTQSASLSKLKPSSKLSISSFNNSTAPLFMPLTVKCNLPSPSLLSTYLFAPKVLNSIHESSESKIPNGFSLPLGVLGLVLLKSKFCFLHATFNFLVISSLYHEKSCFPSTKIESVSQYNTSWSQLSMHFHKFLLA